MSAFSETKCRPVTSPFDGSRLGAAPLASASDIDSALSRAVAAFQDRGSWLPRCRRIEILERVLVSMRDEREALARLASREGGKPIQDSRIEVARAIDGIQLCINHVRTQQGSKISLGCSPCAQHRTAWTELEPIGVVVAVSAFNHPLNLIVHQVAPAVAVGCPVLVKPADDTPLSCLRFTELLHAAGLPEDWCQFLLPESLDLAECLVTDSRVAFFSFIGSARVGWMLRSKLSPGTRCALEHGGASPVIVDSSADLDQVVPMLLKGGFYHAGQVCVSVQRIFLEHTIERAFLDRLCEGAERLVVGDPLDESTEVGPLIRSGEVDRVEAWIKEAVEAGGRARVGGQRLSDQMYAPTILAEPPGSVKVSREEIFGPVVCTYAFDDLDDAIKRANSIPAAFQASVFSKDIDRALYVAGRIRASAVMVNDHSAFRVDGMPFAGLGPSGLGTGGIPYTMEDMQVEKMIVVHSSSI